MNRIEFIRDSLTPSKHRIPTADTDSLPSKFLYYEFHAKYQLRENKEMISNLIVISNGAIPCFCFYWRGRRYKEEKLVKFLTFWNNFLGEARLRKRD